MTTTAITPKQAWLGALQSCAVGGDDIISRGMPAREVLNGSCTIMRPWVIPFDVNGRDFRDFIGAAEAVQLVGGFSEPDWMVEHVQAFQAFREDDGSFWGAYGPRVAKHLGAAVSSLMADPGSRQAVLSVYSSDTDMWTVPPKDVPCTVAIQFFIRAKKLHMTVTMRSNDVWLGLPYDLVQFAALQGAVAAVLGVPMGSYHHQAGSLHLYDKDAARATPVLEAYPRIQSMQAVGKDRDYAPMFNLGSSDSTSRLEEVMWRCRHLQRGHAIPEPTVFEDWLAKALAT